MLQNISITARPISTSDLRKNLDRQIKKSLRLTALQEDILAPYGSGPLPFLWGMQCATLRARWKWIEEAIGNINAAKARQRYLLADLMSEDPWKSMLKKPLDPSQAGPRPNTAHIAATFRKSGEKILRNTYITRHHNWSCAPGIDLVELVPYDRHLELFMRALKKYPSNWDTDASDQLQSMSLNETKEVPARFHYPDDIATDIKVVKDGLMYVYTGSPLLIVPRIEWEPTGGTFLAVQKPVFSICTRSHPEDLPNSVHRCAGKPF